MSQEAIDQITGGDSYCYMDVTEDGTLAFLHVGKHPLSGVQPRIVDMVKFRRSENPGLNFSTILDPFDLAVGKSMVKLDAKIAFSDPAKQDFSIFFTAKNGSWDELLRMRKVEGVWQRAMKVRIEIPPKNKNGKLTFKKVKEEVSKSFPRDDLTDSEWRK